MTLKSCLVLLLAALCSPRAAWSYAAAGTTSAPYLELPMGVRGEGMGEAFTGIADDINSIYYNPAGLTNIDNAQLQLMHLDSFGGIQYENMALATPTDLLGVNMWSTVAVSYTNIGIDNTPLTLQGPGNTYQPTPYSFTAGDSVLTLSYAWQATQLFSVGATIKAINEKIYTYQGMGVAGDVGIMTRPGSLGGMSAGATLENFGTSPVAGATLPTDLRLGAGYDWESIFGPDDLADRALFDVDFVAPVVPVDTTWQLNMGGEYTHTFGRQYAVLRAGYRFPQTVLGPVAGLSVGGSLGTHLERVDLSLDYAWVPYGMLGSMQRIGLTAGFGETNRALAMRAAKGDYLFPPEHVSAAAGDHMAHVTWSPQTGKVDGYNLYMAYSPEAKQWTRLNNAPITGTSMTVHGLYNGYKVYFCASTLARKSLNLYRESDKSKAVMVVPGPAKK